MSIYEQLFFLLWLLNVLIYFGVKQIIKKRYIDIYNEFYGGGFFDNSISSSLRSVKFTLNKNMWKDISDPFVIKSLKVERFFLILFYGYVPMIITAFFLGLL